jgi:hypothetical protein
VKDGASQFQKFHVNFHNLDEVITVRQVLRKMGSENAHGRVQNAENGFRFDVLELYHKDGYEVLIHIVQVAGDETWVLFFIIDTKEQSKQHSRFTFAGLRPVIPRNHRCECLRSNVVSIYFSLEL